MSGKDNFELFIFTGERFASSRRCTLFTPFAIQNLCNMNELFMLLHWRPVMMMTMRIDCFVVAFLWYKFTVSGLMFRTTFMIPICSISIQVAMHLQYCLRMRTSLNVVHRQKRRAMSSTCCSSFQRKFEENFP